MWARRRQTALSLVPFAFCLLCAGCRSNCDLVEAELRTRDFQLHTLRDEFHRLQAYNDALQREVEGLRGGGATLTPEDAARTFTLRGIALARGTGGVDDDGKPGDEALQVVVEPRDPDGHAVKAPGTLFVTALEITPEGIKRPLDAWQVTGDPLRRAWRTGLFSTGYSLTFPWKHWPSSDKVRVVARLVLSDGRSFEAERDVTVRVAPEELRPAPPPDWEVPAPRKLEPPPLPDATTGRTTSAAQPAAHWRPARRESLSGAVELLKPVAVPPRHEWGP
jgi:hypothetical protein